MLASTRAVSLTVWEELKVSILDSMTKDSQVSWLCVKCMILTYGSYFPPARLSITSLNFSTSSIAAITLVCSTRSSPPSIIRWYRDGTLLDRNGNTTDMAVTVTDRRNSYFDVTLNICQSPATVVGTYRCRAGNRLGDDSEYYTVQGTASYSYGSQWCIASPARARVGPVIYPGQWNQKYVNCKKSEPSFLALADDASKSQYRVWD